MQHTVTLETVLENLIEGLNLLIPHSYISKSQAKYLKDLKAKLNKEEAVVILDFSENYSNEAEGYYWTPDSFSLHPAVVYAGCKQYDKTIRYEFLKQYDMHLRIAGFTKILLSVLCKMKQNHLTIGMQISINKWL